MKMLMALVMVLGIGFSSLSHAEGPSTGCMIEIPEVFGNDVLFNQALDAKGFFGVTQAQANNANVKTQLVLEVITAFGPSTFSNVAEIKITDRHDFTLKEARQQDNHTGYYLVNGQNTDTYDAFVDVKEYKKNLEKLFDSVGTCDEVKAKIPQI